MVKSCFSESWKTQSGAFYPISSWPNAKIAATNVKKSERINFFIFSVLNYDEIYKIFIII